MTTGQITETGSRVKGRANSLTDYFRKCRAEKIRQYRAARYWCTRRDARNFALHYGRLIRRMEGRS